MVTIYTCSASDFGAGKGECTPNPCGDGGTCSVAGKGRDRYPVCECKP